MRLDRHPHEMPEPHSFGARIEPASDALDEYVLDREGHRWYPCCCTVCACEALVEYEDGYCDDCRYAAHDF